MKDSLKLKHFRFFLLILGVLTFLSPGCSKSNDQLEQDSAKYFEQAVDYYQRGYLNNAKDLFESVIDLEKDLRLKENFGNANLYLGLISFSEEDYEAALEYNRKAKEFFKVKMKRKEEGIAENNIGNILSASGEYENAETHYRKSLLLCQLTADKEGEADVLMNIAQLFFEKGDFRRAFDHFSKAYDSYELIGSIDGKINSSIRMGVCHFKFGSYDDALSSFDYALETSEANGNMTHRAEIVNLIGLTHFQMGDHNNSIQYFESAARLAETNQDPSLKWIAKNNLADVFAETYQYKKAIDNYYQAIRTSHEYGEELTSALIKLKLGLVYLYDYSNGAENQLSGAKNIFEDLTDFFDDIEFNSGKLNSLAGLNKCLRIQNLTTDARENLDEIKKLLINYPITIKNKLTEQFCISPEIIKKLNTTETLFFSSEKDEAVIHDMLLKNNLLKSQVKESERFIPQSEDGINKNPIRILHEIDFLKFEIANEKAKPSGYSNSAKIDYFKNLLERKLELLENSKNRGKEIVKEVFTISEFRKHLNDEQLILAFFNVKERINVSLISKNQTQNYLIQISEETLRGQIKALIKSINNDEAVISRDILRGMYFNLIKPIENSLTNFKEIVLYFSLENEVFSLIPFHALLDDSGKHLIERYSVNYFGGFTKNKNMNRASKNIVVSSEKNSNDIYNAGGSFELFGESISLKEKIKSSYSKNLVILSPVYIRLTEPSASHFKFDNDSSYSEEGYANISELSSVQSQNIFTINYYDDHPASAFYFSQMFPNVKSIFVNRILNDEKSKRKLAIDILTEFSKYPDFKVQEFYKNKIQSEDLLWCSLFCYKKI